MVVFRSRMFFFLFGWLFLLVCLFVFAFGLHPVTSVVTPGFGGQYGTPGEVEGRTAVHPRLGACKTNILLLRHHSGPQGCIF